MRLCVLSIAESMNSPSRHQSLHRPARKSLRLVAVLIQTAVFVAATKPPSPFSTNREEPSPRTSTRTSRNGAIFAQGGTHFNTRLNLNGVAKVIVRAGDYIEGIQLHFRDRTDSLFAGGYNFYGGTEFTFIVPPGDRINRVSVWSGCFTDAIQFHTQKGTSSPRYGGSGGTKEELLAPNRDELIGISGRVSKYLQEISFKWGRGASADAVLPEEEDCFDRKVKNLEQRLGCSEELSRNLHDRLIAAETALEQAIIEIDAHKESERSKIQMLASLEAAVTAVTCELKERYAAIESLIDNVKQIELKMSASNPWNGSTATIYHMH